MKEVDKNWAPGGKYLRIMKIIWIVLALGMFPPVVYLVNYAEPVILGMPFIIFWLATLIVLFAVTSLVAAIKLELPVERED
jgi:hypothetical protein